MNAARRSFFRLVGERQRHFRKEKFLSKRATKRLRIFGACVIMQPISCATYSIYSKGQGVVDGAKAY
jgi:hypothetical protein